MSYREKFIVVPNQAASVSFLSGSIHYLISLVRLILEGYGVLRDSIVAMRHQFKV